MFLPCFFIANVYAVIENVQRKMGVTDIFAFFWGRFSPHSARAGDSFCAAGTQRINCLLKNKFLVQKRGVETLFFMGTL